MKDQTLYLECYSGISGDMTVAALLDLGADPRVLMDGLKSLLVDGFEIKIGRRSKSGIDACDFDVILTHQEDHTHTHSHSHSHHAGHRNLFDVKEIIQNSRVSQKAKETAISIFEIVAEAEAKAHGLPLDQVHFHEVGALDSIADIVAAAICLDNLNITRVIVSPLHEGHGHIRCQHGVLPIPVPAVSNIVSAHQLPIQITETEGELVTPTGAAIAAAIRTDSQLPPCYTIKKIGLGAGKRTYDHASGILRAMLIEAEEASGIKEDAPIWILETNMDDVSGEALSFTMEQLLGAGARDVYYTPIYMKKNRPAYQLSILCEEDLIPAIEQLVFLHTTTIGIRKYPAMRSTLPRDIVSVNTPLGTGSVKICQYGNNRFYYPEFESVKKLALENHTTFDHAFGLLKSCAENQVGKDCKP